MRVNKWDRHAYLICGMNDEDYAYPEYEVVYTMDEVNFIVDKWIDEYRGEEDFYVEEYETDDGYRYDITYGSDRFYVIEVKDFYTSHNRIVVYHHAFNGVGFSIEHYGSENSCEKYINDIAEERRNNTDDEIIEHKWNTLLVDNGNEWEMWYMLQVEYSEDKEGNL